MKPSHNCGIVQIFLVIRRERSVVDTNGCRDLYVVTAIITWKNNHHIYESLSIVPKFGKLAVRRKSVGRTASSMTCCMNAAKISGLKASAIEKQMFIAATQVPSK
jgi:hypothetical protein